MTPGPQGGPASPPPTPLPSRFASWGLARRPRAGLSLLLLALLLAGGGWWLWDRRWGEQARVQRRVERLATASVSQADLFASTDATGVVNAVRKVNLSPNVASRIAQLQVAEGDRVAAGALVARMESEAIEARANQARSRLQAAEAQSRASAARRRRHEGLLASGAISVELMEELRNQERQARIGVEEVRYELQAALAELRNTEVRAPFAGIITRQFAQVGQFVTPTTTASEKDGATSTSIAELSSGLEVIGKVAEANLTEIQAGQAVEIRSDAFPGQVFRGRVTMVSPRAVTENQVNAFPVSIALESGDSRLKPAMTVQVRFLAPPIRGALLVPLVALTSSGDGRKGVLRRRDGQLQFVPVRPGRISGERVQVEGGGLQRGDQVLIASPPPGVEIPGYTPPR